VLSYIITEIELTQRNIMPSLAKKNLAKKKKHEEKTGKQ
jgi:hypothetical protein